MVCRFLNYTAEQFCSNFSLFTFLVTTTAIKQLSDLLQTGFSRDTLAAIISLLEMGYSPEGVVALVQKIQQQNPTS